MKCQGTAFNRAAMNRTNCSTAFRLGVGVKTGGSAAWLCGKALPFRPAVSPLLKYRDLASRRKGKALPHSGAAEPQNPASIVFIQTLWAAATAGYAITSVTV